MVKNARKRGRTPSRTRRRTPMRGARRTRRVRRTRTRGGLGGSSDGIQRFNRGGTRTFTVNRTLSLGNITVAATPSSVLYAPSTDDAPLWSTYTTQFTKMKVNWIKMRFELTTFEQTDDSIMPTIYIRKNFDPDLTTAAFSQTYFMSLPGTIKKTFTAGSNVLEFKFKPQIMTAGLQTAAGTYMPMPRRAGYVDSTQDITLYGLMYYVSPGGLNQLILNTVEWDVTWKDPK